jgi:hypothetical protein
LFELAQPLCGPATEVCSTCVFTAVVHVVLPLPVHLPQSQQLAVLALAKSSQATPVIVNNNNNNNGGYARPSVGECARALGPFLPPVTQSRGVQAMPRSCVRACGVLRGTELVVVHNSLL